MNKIEKPENLIKSPLGEDDIEQIETIEQIFFAYKDFTADPDLILGPINFGRAHHRALYFVNRKPGLTVAELLEILEITKQSLARVLRHLIDGGYIVQNEGAGDRRKRLLYPTPKGRELIIRLSRPQSHRIEKALAAAGSNSANVVARFLKAMINSEQG